MEVILLERIARLGQMGDVVRVRDGYARNFLLPQGKALRSNEDSRKRFESERVHFEARDLERRQEAEGVAAKLQGKAFVLVRQAGETGQLYGSVTTRDLAEAMEAGGFAVNRSQIALNQPIKTIGMHEVRIDLHAEVAAHIVANVARSDDEAARQARGENVTQAGAGDSDEDEAAASGTEATAEGEEAATEGESAEAGETAQS